MFATALLYWELYVDVDSKSDAPDNQFNAPSSHKAGRVYDEQDFQVRLLVAI